MSNEKRLIYADSGKVVLEYMKKHIVVGESDFLQGYVAGIEGLANALAELPTVDAVEVVHGRWIEYRCLLIKENICSNCKEFYLQTHNYCPNCGAKMDRERKDKDD